MQPTGRHGSSTAPRALVQAAAAARSGFLNCEKYAAVDTERRGHHAGATVKVGAPQHAQVVLHRTEPRAPSMIYDRKRHAWRLWSRFSRERGWRRLKQTRLDVKGHVFETPVDAGNGLQGC